MNATTLNSITSLGALAFALFLCAISFYFWYVGTKKLDGHVAFMVSDFAEPKEGIMARFTWVQLRPPSDQDPDQEPSVWLRFGRKAELIVQVGFGMSAKFHYFEFRDGKELYERLLFLCNITNPAETALYVSLHTLARRAMALKLGKVIECNSGEFARVITRPWGTPAVIEKLENAG